MNLFYGAKVILSPHLADDARFELSPGLRAIVGPACVADFNAWSREFFGVKPVIMRLTGPDGDTLICSPAGYLTIKRIAEKEGSWPAQST